MLFYNALFTDEFTVTFSQPTIRVDGVTMFMQKLKAINLYVFFFNIYMGVHYSNF